MTVFALIPIHFLAHSLLFHFTTHSIRVDIAMETKINKRIIWRKTIYTKTQPRRSVAVAALFWLVFILFIFFCFVSFCWPLVYGAPHWCIPLVWDHSIFALPQKSLPFCLCACIQFFYIVEHAQQFLTHYSITWRLLHTHRHTDHETSSEFNGVYLGSIALYVGKVRKSGFCTKPPSAIQNRKTPFTEFNRTMSTVQHLCTRTVRGFIFNSAHKIQLIDSFSRLLHLK